jgi:hypothetical protein
MTPAERLLAAADLLEKRAGDATDGPWKARSYDFDEDGHDFADVIGKQEVEQYAGSYTIKTALVAGGAPEPADLGYLHPTNATYIATMHPEVGKALAAWLRLETRYGRSPSGLAVTLADLLLAGAS